MRKEIIKLEKELEEQEKLWREVEECEDRITCPEDYYSIFGKCHPNVRLIKNKCRRIKRLLNKIKGIK